MEGIEIVGWVGFSSCVNGDGGERLRSVRQNWGGASAMRFDSILVLLRCAGTNDRLRFRRVETTWGSRGMAVFAADLTAAKCRPIDRHNESGRMWTVRANYWDGESGEMCSIRAKCGPIDRRDESGRPWTVRANYWHGES